MKHTRKNDLTTAYAYDLTRFNALRHGVLSRYTVLPWEDSEEYGTLLAALVAEFSPQGPTEEHLVEELAGIIWRKQRLRLAESAVIRHGFREELMDHAAIAGEDVISAILSIPANTEIEVATVAKGEQKAKQSLGILLSRREDAYESAIKELCPDPHDWWASMMALLEIVGNEPWKQQRGKAPASNVVKEEPRPASSKGGNETRFTSKKDEEETFAVILRWFLETIVLPWFEDLKTKLATRRLTRDYACGSRSTPTRSRSYTATKCISIANLNEYLPCCCGLRILSNGR